MSNLPADWAINRAFKGVSEPDDAEWLKTIDPPTPYARAVIKLARYIEAHEEPPVDRKLLVAREAVARDFPNYRGDIERGEWDGNGMVISAQSAITLWEDGFGKDPETTAPKCQ